MPTSATFIDARIVAIVTVLTVALVGCSPTPASPATGAATAGPPSLPIPSPSPTLAGLDAPPEATLAAEGGDPVTGQLGTYTWRDTGSDSPWLRGARISVGAGEPLIVAFVPPTGAVSAWQARYVPSAAGTPDGAAPLGEGTGEAAFTAPGPGSWSVELVVEFTAAAGSASYFWRLEVE